MTGRLRVRSTSPASGSARAAAAPWASPAPGRDRHADRSVDLAASHRQPLLQLVVERPATPPRRRQPRNGGPLTAISLPRERNTTPSACSIRTRWRSWSTRRARAVEGYCRRKRIFAPASPGARGAVRLTRNAPDGSKVGGAVTRVNGRTGRARQRAGKTRWATASITVARATMPISASSAST